MISGVLYCLKQYKKYFYKKLGVVPGVEGIDKIRSESVN